MGNGDTGPVFTIEMEIGKRELAMTVQDYILEVIEAYQHKSDVMGSRGCCAADNSCLKAGLYFGADRQVMILHSSLRVHFGRSCFFGGDFI